MHFNDAFLFYGLIIQNSVFKIVILTSPMCVNCTKDVFDRSAVSSSSLTANENRRLVLHANMKHLGINTIQLIIITIDSRVKYSA